VTPWQCPGVDGQISALKVSCRCFISSDGVADYIWTKLAQPGEDILAVGQRRYEREDTPFSHENCKMADLRGSLVGMLVAFPMAVDEEYEETDPMAVIRRAKASDASALADLAERTFRDAFSAQNIATDIDLHCTTNFGTGIQRREILDPDWVTLLAEVDKVLSAYAQVRLRSPQQCVLAKRPSELLRLYVSRDLHGRGIAHELMPEVLATAASNEADVVWLGVWEENPRAIAFYRKYGFEIVGAHEFRLGEEIQRDLIMAVTLQLIRSQSK